MTSEIIAASIRHPEHVVTAARIGCEIATVPAKVLRQMLNHPLTTAGAEKFRADWESAPRVRRVAARADRPVTCQCTRGFRIWRCAGSRRGSSRIALLFRTYPYRAAASRAA